MATIGSLEQQVLDTLEEQAPGIFYSQQDEVRVALCEAMNELTLITAEPGQQGTLLLTAGNTIISLPSNMLCLFKMWGTSEIPKTSMEKLDNVMPGWEGATPAAVPQAWFPFGLGKVGVYPQLSAPLTVNVSFVPILVTGTQPYSSSIAFDFQSEYQDSAIRYASDMLKLKEGDQEWQMGAKFQSFLDGVRDLSAFARRQGALKFSMAKGVPARITEIKTK